MEEGVVYTPTHTAALFHADNSFVRAIKGPVGSGKSTACCFEILKRSMEQKPFRGVRRSRWLVVRNTFAELKATTIRTFMDWLGDTGKITYDSPIRFNSVRTLSDGTVMDMEVFFLPLDRAEDVKKLKSLEVTGAWINEASEVPEEALKLIRGRIDRYPSVRMGGASWAGIWLDTNPPSTNSWFYRLFEIDRPKNHRVFHQPGGLMRDPERPGEYLPNPDAENIENHSSRYDYYYNQIPGNTEDYIKVYVLGEYGATYSGKAVYPSFDEQAHIAQSMIQPSRAGPIVVGLDWGLNPAAVFTQLNPTGALIVLDEISPQDVTFDEFIGDYLLPTIAQKYSHFVIQCVGDPAGMGRNPITKLTMFQMLRQRGLSGIPASSNDFIPRRDAVAFFLARRGGFIMNPGCATLHEGFNGGYRYEKLQTGRETYKEKPEKGRHSHIHDALQYAALYWHRGLTKKPRVRPQVEQRRYLYA